MIRIALILMFIATASFAVEPDEILSDPVLEARARDISTNLRCVVCQNENIDSSNAGVARDLRLLVRERLVAGDTDDQVYDFVVARYGDFVLFRPPWKPTTYALWLSPFVAALVGIFMVTGIFRRLAKRRENDILDLDETELALINEAVARHNSGDGK
tara:strand:- start:1259 stop:1732 length:474 start_codon:yes stop_codon:yes gene_type:complete